MVRDSINVKYVFNLIRINRIVDRSSKEQFQVSKKDMFIRPKLAKPDASIDRTHEIDAANEKTIGKI